MLQCDLHLIPPPLANELSAFDKRWRWLRRYFDVGEKLLELLMFLWSMTGPPTFTTLDVSQRFFELFSSSFGQKLKIHQWSTTVKDAPGIEKKKCSHWRKIQQKSHGIGFGQSNQHMNYSELRRLDVVLYKNLQRKPESPWHRMRHDRSNCDSMLAPVGNGIRKVGTSWWLYFTHPAQASQGGCRTSNCFWWSELQVSCLYKAGASAFCVSNFVTVSLKIYFYPVNSKSVECFQLQTLTLEVFQRCTPEVKDY